jgi:hypothetical protein
VKPKWRSSEAYLGSEETMKARVGGKRWRRELRRQVEEVAGEKGEVWDQITSVSCLINGTREYLKAQHLGSHWHSVGA